jgi:hypothetical protein
MKTMAEQWASYERDVVPDTAGPIQRIESARAFYAGAQALLDLISGLGVDDISDDQGAAMIESLHQELKAFADDVQAGRA